MLTLEQIKKGKERKTQYDHIPSILEESEIYFSKLTTPIDRALKAPKINFNGIENNSSKI